MRLSVVLSPTTCNAHKVAAALRTLSVATRLEPGCLGCSVWSEVGDSAHVHYEEQWATEAAMEARVKSDRFTQLLEVLEAAPVAPIVQFDFVARQAGLDYVEAVRGAHA